MSDAYREIATPGMVTLTLTIGCAYVVLFTFLGPLGTGRTLTWDRRLAYGALVTVSCFSLAYSVTMLTLYLVRLRSSPQVALAMEVTALALAAPCTATTYTAYAMFHGGRGPSSQLGIIFLTVAISLLGIEALVYYVLYMRLHIRRMVAVEDFVAPPDADAEADGVAHTVSAGLAAARTDRSRASPAPSSQQPGVESKRLFKCLPAELGRDIVCLHVSGHYLHVTTTAGSAVILMRLGDAVAELGDRGMQIHRSYWVAHRHVRRMVRRDHRTVLLLTSGQELPVSRSLLPAIRGRVANRARDSQQ